MRKFILLALLCVGFAVQAQPVKVGHMGLAAYDVILRKLTNENPNVMVLSIPGGRGTIAYEALDSKKIDFLAVAGGAIFTEHVFSPDIVKFDPLEKYKFVSVVSRGTPRMMIPKAYASIEELAAKKCVPGQVVFVAKLGGIEPFVAKEALKNYPCTFEEVPYNASNDLAYIDIVSGRLDFTATAAVVLDKYADVATVLPMSASPSPLLHALNYDMFLLARKDVTEAEVEKFLGMLRQNSNTEDMRQWQKNTKTSIKLSTGRAADADMESTKRVYVNLLKYKSK